MNQIANRVRAAVKGANKGPRSSRLGDARPHLLLSAYACEPGRGSEPGVGFAWLTALLERGGQVVLLTRANNVASVTAQTRTYIELGQLVIHGLDITGLLPLKKAGLLPVHLYYMMWQIAAYQHARRTIREEILNVGLIWHITFGLCRFPTFMSLLPVDTIIGPVGGAESMPWRFLFHLGVKGALSEATRYVANMFSRSLIANAIAYRKAALVLFKTPETARAYGKYCQASEIRIEIGTGMTRDAPPGLAVRPVRSGPLKLLYVGRLLHWKGVRLMCEAFLHALSAGVTAEFHIVGRGPEEEFVRQFIERHGLAEKMHRHGTVAQQAALVEMAISDLLLMPSLHDSSGTVILEALDVGTPVLALALGGPLVLLGDDYPGLVEARGRSYKETVAEFGDRITRFALDGAYRQTLRSFLPVIRYRRSFERNVSSLVGHPLFQKVMPEAERDGALAETR